MWAEYGVRKEKYAEGKNGSPRRYFRWAGWMVYWISFWRIHSGSLGFLTPEEEAWIPRRRKEWREGPRPKKRRGATASPAPVTASGSDKDGHDVWVDVCVSAEELFCHGVAGMHPWCCVTKQCALFLLCFLKKFIE